jgi:hypothetical protein
MPGHPGEYRSHGIAQIQFETALDAGIPPNEVDATVQTVTGSWKIFKNYTKHYKATSSVEKMAKNWNRGGDKDYVSKVLAITTNPEKLKAAINKVSQMMLDENK